MSALALHTAPAQDPEGSVLSGLFERRKPGLHALLKDRQRVAAHTRRLADEVNRHQDPVRVQKRLRKMHVMDALLMHVSTTWRQDRDEAVVIVGCLYSIFGKGDVRQRMRGLCLDEVLELIGT